MDLLIAWVFYLIIMIEVIKNNKNNKNNKNKKESYKITNFIKETNLNNSIVIGYYGGVNYGDELIMEVLMNLLDKKGVKNCIFLYMKKKVYGKFHHNFKNINIISNKIRLFVEIIRSKKIVIGGGGLWGLDANKSILILGIILFISRFILFKKVYLLGVGYYNSTNILGKLSAFLVGKSSSLIFARDIESYKRFRKITNKVYLDKDIVFYINKINLFGYSKDLDLLKKDIKLSKKTIFISIRNYPKETYQNYIYKIIENNKDKDFVFLEFSAENDDQFLCKKLLFDRNYKNVKIIEFYYNPVALYLFMKENNKKILSIFPQYHGQLVSFLTNTEFFPVIYDNKNRELIDTIGLNEYYNIESISHEKVQEFIQKKY